MMGVVKNQSIRTFARMSRMSRKWTVNAGGQAREQTLKLKLDGDKLTGAVLGRNNRETAIEDGKYKDGEVSFKINREMNGNNFTIKYKGKIEGDTFKGQRELDRDGQTNIRKFEAKRAKE